MIEDSRNRLNELAPRLMKGFQGDYFLVFGSGYDKEEWLKLVPGFKYTRHASFGQFDNALAIELNWEKGK